MSYGLFMTPLEELELQAEKLPEADRATLAARLLASLPPVLEDADDGLAEAKRRSAELDEDDSLGLSEAEFRVRVAASRRR